MGSQVRGFTLLELLITITVAGILLGLAVPATQVLLANNRTVAATNATLGVLHNARAEAIRQNQRVWISPGGSDEEGYSWQKGVAMSAEVDNQASDDILRRTGTIDERLVVTVRNANATPRAFGFSPGGYLLENLAGPVFVFCNSVQPQNSREIHINAGGQIRMKTPEPELTDCGGA
ncbi:MAG: GspH/FimT family pseudopilin [Oleiphilaceae bacterium]|nr:GspH/FimT family pseudopilin [Oleiphilaceae bacterium]